MPSPLILQTVFNRQEFSVGVKTSRPETGRAARESADARWHETGMGKETAPAENIRQPVTGTASGTGDRLRTFIT
jgi:hypothetical protein